LRVLSKIDAISVSHAVGRHICLKGEKLHPDKLCVTFVVNETFENTF